MIGIEKLTGQSLVESYSLVESCVRSVMIKKSVVSYGSKEEKAFKSADVWRDRSERLCRRANPIVGLIGWVGGGRY